VGFVVLGTDLPLSSFALLPFLGSPEGIPLWWVQGKALLAAKLTGL